MTGLPAALYRSQGLMVVYMMGMYISSAPFTSQMHASAQLIGDDGRTRNRHQARAGGESGGGR